MFACTLNTKPLNASASGSLSNGSITITGDSLSNAIAIHNTSPGVIEVIGLPTLDTATNTLYVALHDANAISEIDTQTLTETTRFSTHPYDSPTSLVIAGPSMLFENAAQAWRKKDCTWVTFWLAAAVAGYWSLALGLFIIQIALAI